MVSFQEVLQRRCLTEGSGLALSPNTGCRASLSAGYTSVLRVRVQYHLWTLSFGFFSLCRGWSWDISQTLRCHWGNVRLTICLDPNGSLKTPQHLVTRLWLALITTLKSFESLMDFNVCIILCSITVGCGVDGRRSCELWRRTMRQKKKKVRRTMLKTLIDQSAILAKDWI